MLSSFYKVTFAFAFALLHFSHASPQSSPSISISPSKPTRPFTAQAFVSPFPANTPGQLSGLPVVAENGLFFLNPNAMNSSASGRKETVFSVDSVGQAFLNARKPQQVYLDTATGALSYLSPSTHPPNAFTAGALTTLFLHLGEGTSLTTPCPQCGPGNFVNAGPGTFQWIGSVANPTWAACPRPGGKLQIMKDVGGKENWQLCTFGLQLVALDWSGGSPVDSY